MIISYLKWYAKSYQFWRFTLTDSFYIQKTLMHWKNFKITMNCIEKLLSQKLSFSEKNYSEI